MATVGRSPDTHAERDGGSCLDGVGSLGSAGLAQDLLDSIFRVATELVRGERASLMLREDASTDFVMAKAVGIAEDVRKHVRVPPAEGAVGPVPAPNRPPPGPPPDPPPGPPAPHPRPSPTPPSPP